MEEISQGYHEYMSILRNDGISLESSLQSKEIGLNIESALKVLEIARKYNYAIIKGAVFIKNNNKLISANIHWENIQLSNEDRSEFIKRSWKRAEKYLLQMSSISKNDYLVVLKIV